MTRASWRRRQMCGLTSTVRQMAQARRVAARRLFAPIASNYERWASVLSLGQDARWRRELVTGMAPAPGSLVLDVAAGTGSITRGLQDFGAKVISLDLSPEMLGWAVERGADGVLADGEVLPFLDETFDGLTFGYLLRYVADVDEALAELVRVVRRGGRVGMLEFSRPDGVTGGLWSLYAGRALPVAGAMISDGWRTVGSFLRPSIEDFADRYPPDVLRDAWQRAGLSQVEYRRMSLGGGLVMWGTRK